MPLGLADVRSIIGGTLDDVERIATSPALMADMLADLRTAERGLAARLRAEAVNYGGHDARFTGAAALAYQHQVQLATEYLSHRLTGNTTAQAKAAIAASVTRSASVMDGLNQRFSGIVTPLRLRQAETLRAVSSSAQGLWARSFPTSVDRYGVKMMSEFEEIMRAGLVSGSSMDDVIAALTGHGGPTGKVSMRAVVTPRGVLRTMESDIPEGLFVRHRYWAERLVRTETLRAYNAARHESIVEMHKQFPTMQRKILATLDNRTADDSKGVHGQIRGIKDPFTDGAGRVYMFPPARPNDRETVIPWRPEWEPSSDNLSDWEKACLGELDADGEEALAKKMEAIAVGAKPRKARAPRDPNAPAKTPKVVAPNVTTPREMKSPPTFQQTVEADLRKRLKYESGVGATIDGQQLGFVAPSSDGKSWAFYRRSRATSELGRADIEQFATREAAKAALLEDCHYRLAQTAQSIEKWDVDAYKQAVRENDGMAARRRIRGLLWENGVLPRDAVFALDEADECEILPVIPGARAQHHWNGRVDVARKVWEEANDPDPNRFHDHLKTMLHEELHGSTNYSTIKGRDASIFYRGAASSIEEATVELAARRIGAKATGLYANYYGGSYQPVIARLAQITMDSYPPGTFGTTGTNYPTESVFKAIADAGIRMRAIGAKLTTDTPAEMLRSFVDSVGKTLKKMPKDQQERLMRSIAANLGTPHT